MTLCKSWTMAALEVRSKAPAHPRFQSVTDVNNQRHSSGQSAQYCGGCSISNTVEDIQYCKEISFCILEGYHSILLSMSRTAEEYNK